MKTLYKQTKGLPKTEVSTKGLINVLFNNIDMLRNNEMRPEVGRAILDQVRAVGLVLAETTKAASLAADHLQETLPTATILEIGEAQK